MTDAGKGSRAALGGALLIFGYAVVSRSPDRDVGTVDGLVVELEMAGLEFPTQDLRVQPGTTVRWTNRDPVPHTVTPDSEAATWGSALIGPGETFERTFDTEGEYSYHCRPHPFMKAGIVVERLGPS